MEGQALRSAPSSTLAPLVARAVTTRQATLLAVVVVAGQGRQVETAKRVAMVGNLPPTPKAAEEEEELAIRQQRQAQRRPWELQEGLEERPKTTPLEGLVGPQASAGQDRTGREVEVAGPMPLAMPPVALEELALRTRLPRVALLEEEEAAAAEQSTFHR